MVTLLYHRKLDDLWKQVGLTLGGHGHRQRAGCLGRQTLQFLATPAAALGAVKQAVLDCAAQHSVGCVDNIRPVM
jgi:hypothetical protein